MKKSVVNILVISATSLVMLSGCASRPRFGQINTAHKPAPAIARQIEMTVPQAKKVLQDAITNPPAGRRRNRVDFDFICKYVNKVQYRQHSKTKFYLVELMTNNRKYITFYVADRRTAQNVVQAVWCLSAK